MLAQFTCDWIQIPLGYENTKWVDEHKPILSRNNGTLEGDHTLFTKFSMGSPEGHIVVCPMGCPQPLEQKVGQENILLLFKTCKVKMLVPIFKTSQDTFLTMVDIIPVPFPRPRYFAHNWESVEEVRQKELLTSWKRGGCSGTLLAKSTPLAMTSRSLSLPALEKPRPASMPEDKVELPPPPPPAQRPVTLRKLPPPLISKSASASPLISGLSSSGNSLRLVLCVPQRSPALQVSPSSLISELGEGGSTSSSSINTPALSYSSSKHHKRSETTSTPDVALKKNKWENLCM